MLLFWLKLFDTPLCSFEITNDLLEGQKAHLLWVDTEKTALLPIGMKPNDESMMAWLRGRLIPNSREFANSFLFKNGLNQRDTRGILQICRGLSLNDSY